MKKIVFLLILLLAAGVAGFFAGRIIIPAGSTGVIHSGLSGLLGPFKQDKLYWSWQKLIPGDTQLYLLPADNFTVTVPLSTKLPGLDNIPAGTPVVGNIELELSLQMRLHVKLAIKLVAEGVTNVRQYVSQQLDIFKLKIRHKLLQIIEQDTRAGTPTKIEIICDNILKKELQLLAATSFTNHPLKLLATDCSLKLVPDMNRYLQLRRALAGNINDLTAFIRTRRNQTAIASDRVNRLNAERAHWEATGKLINRFPKLLNFLTIQKLAPNVKISLLQGGISSLMNYTDIIRAQRGNTNK